MTLNANGTEMAGLTVIVTIREIDSIGADDEIAAELMQFNGSAAVSAWTAVWMEDGLGGPEYVFSVLGFDSPVLTVD